MTIWTRKAKGSRKIFLSVRRRGQAAMEYMINYAWAIMVTVLVLSSLLYLGVFSVGARMPDTCNFQIGLLCTDFRATTDDGSALSLTLVNGYPNTIYLCKLVCDAAVTSPPADVAACASPATSQEMLKTGERKTVTFRGSQPCWTEGSYAFQVGEKYTGKIYLLYSEEGDAGHARVAVGEVVTRIQA